MIRNGIGGSNTQTGLKFESVNNVAHCATSTVVGGSVAAGSSEQ